MITIFALGSGIILSAIVGIARDIYDTQYWED
jgi:hypothetical protein